MVHEIDEFGVVGNGVVVEEEGEIWDGGEEVFPFGGEDCGGHGGFCGEF